MNNITWGDNKATSYYETVAGGAGAVCSRSILEFISNENERSFRVLNGMVDQVFIHI